MAHKGSITALYTVLVEGDDYPTPKTHADGVDAVFVGPNDLAHTMGHENRWQEAPVQRAIERAVRAVADAGKCPGVLTLDEASRQRYADWGARYFANVASSLVMRAFEQAAGRGGALRY